MKNFWQEQIQKYWKLCLLAPMDWYWDSAYRQTVKKIAPHVICVSEFFSADWLIHSKHLAEQVLPHTKIETPLIMQIFGKDPEIFAKAWKIIEQEKYDMYWIDINMWCPAKKVVRSGHWSSLLINEQTAFNIVQKIDEAVKLPISVKTRLSFDWWQDLIKFWKGLEKAWCKLLTVHGRTAKQAYTWIANWEPIYLLKNELQIPVIWNWDVQNFTDWMKKVKNLDWFMIGRWSFWNPWCFLWKEHLNESEKKFFINWQYHPTLQEILDIMEFHAEKLVETKWEHKWSLEIRKHLVQYLKNFPWVKAYRKKLVTTESIENTQNTLNEINASFKTESIISQEKLNELKEERENLNIS